MEEIVVVRAVPLDHLDRKLLEFFPGKVVRKDLLGPLKGQLNVPTYVVEYLLGKYCSSADSELIEQGLKEVKRILTENYVRPDQSEVLKKKIREARTYRVIDKVKARLVETEDKYWAELVNLQIHHVNIEDRIIDRYEKVLAGGIWAIIDITYNPNLYHKGVMRPFVIEDLRPIQLAITSFDDLKEKRKDFSTDEWIDVLIRSTGLEPAHFGRRVKLLLLMRLLPLAENNYNLVELGPRGTGKSYVYRELSPYAILVSGGETTVPSLFVSHIGRGRIGLVGLWDVVAFDEVAGLSKLRESAGVQIMKDYMESGSFSRGREEITALASMVFVGNIHHDIDQLVRTSHLFIPFPEEMQDLAFLDRFHAYLPGWEVPKIQPQDLTDHYGFVVDYLAEFLREWRRQSFTTAFDEYFDLGEALSKRDEKAVRKTVSALVKALHPDGQFSKEEIGEYLRLAMEMRQRVKEQLKRMGGVEYWNTAFSIISRESGMEETLVVPESIPGTSVPSTVQPPGVAYTVGWDVDAGRASLFRIEAQLMKGRGSCRVTGASGKAMKDAIKTAFDFIKARSRELKVEKVLDQYDVHVQVINLMQAKEGSQTGLGTCMAILSALYERPLEAGVVVIGEMSIQGGVLPLHNVGESIQVVAENGGRGVVLPSSSRELVDSVPPGITSSLGINCVEDVRDCMERVMLSSVEEE
jgi:ATP-dependent Lon protease